MEAGEDGLEVCLSDQADNTLQIVDGCLYNPPGAPVAPVFGQAELASPGWFLVNQAPNVWHDTGLCVNLPEAGTYRLDGSIVHSLRATFGVNLSTRLLDATAAAVVPMSHRRLATEGNIGVIETAPAGGLFYAVTGPTDICLQAFHDTPAGDTTSGGVLTTPDLGTTMLSFERVI